MGVKARTRGKVKEICGGEERDKDEDVRGKLSHGKEVERERKIGCRGMEV